MPDGTPAVRNPQTGKLVPVSQQSVGTTILNDLATVLYGQPRPTEVDASTRILPPLGQSQNAPTQTTVPNTMSLIEWLMGLEQSIQQATQPTQQATRPTAASSVPPLPPGGPKVPKGALKLPATMTVPRAMKVPPTTTVPPERNRPQGPPPLPPGGPEHQQAPSLQQQQSPYDGLAAIVEKLMGMQDAQLNFLSRPQSNIVRRDMSGNIINEANPPLRGLAAWEAMNPGAGVDPAINNMALRGTSPMGSRDIQTGQNMNPQYQPAPRGVSDVDLSRRISAAQAANANPYGDLFAAWNAISKGRQLSPEEQLMRAWGLLPQ